MPHLDVELVIHLRREGFVAVQRVNEVVGAVLPARRPRACLESKVLKVERVAARTSCIRRRGRRRRLPRVRGVCPGLRRGGRAAVGGVAGARPTRGRRRWADGSANRSLGRASW